ncbi:SWI/SNF complex protein [Ceratobasidium theobromae]|uniref:SWI/SNF complex protein n=1 Tax=Ceratobasidium theobromae TaxID=1582974 RepID=A0A5N5Q879_9AGAM|nr:SWI/SNF complex protein [Ceratobasidium theobromae]
MAVSYSPQVDFDTPGGLQPPDPDSHPAFLTNSSQQISATSPQSLELRKPIYKTTPESTTAPTLTPAQATLLLSKNFDARTSDGRRVQQRSIRGDGANSESTQARQFHSSVHQHKNPELHPSCDTSSGFLSTVPPDNFAHPTANPPAPMRQLDHPQSGQGTSRLLEGIAIHNMGWGLVAKQVGTHIHEQCVRHPLQFPFGGLHSDNATIMLTGCTICPS